MQLALQRCQAAGIVFWLRRIAASRAAALGLALLLATAVAALDYATGYELRMATLDPGEAPGAEFEPATFDQIEGFYAHLDRAITASGFFNPTNSKRLWPRLRRLFGRIRLEKDEVNILRGMLTAFEKHQK